MAVFAATIAAGDGIKYQLFVYGGFVWEIYVNNNIYYYVNTVSELFTGFYTLYRGYYMSAHVLLNLLNQFGERDKM